MFDRHAVLRAALAVICALGLGSVASVASAQALRPEVGKPLQAAGDALKAKRYADANARLREAEAVPNKTAAEQSVVDRMRAAVASASGDTAGMVGVINGGRLPAAEQLRMVQSVAGAYYTQRDYANAATWTQRYFKEGGNDPQMRAILLQSYYLGGNCAEVSRALQGAIQADDAAGRAPPEEQLQMLASCYQKTRDNNGYVAAIEKLATYYPKKEYWADLVGRVQSKKGFADRLVLDVYRLKLASGLMNGANDYMEMAQMALADEHPGEAKKIVDQGYASKVLGVGPDAPRQQRLADLANKRSTEALAQVAQEEKDAMAARDGNDLVALGFNLVEYGQAAKGIPMMEQGIKKGGLRQPEDAKLHLGIAYYLAGQKPKAVQIFKTVGGTDGTADLARLWVLQARR